MYGLFPLPARMNPFGRVRLMAGGDKSGGSPLFREDSNTGISAQSDLPLAHYSESALCMT